MGLYAIMGITTSSFCITKKTRNSNREGEGILPIISVIGDFVVEKYVSITPGFFCFRYIFLSVPAYMYLRGFNIKEMWIPILLSGVYLSLKLYRGIPEKFDSFLPNGWEAQTSLGFFYTLFLFVLLS